jgi:hypothetical protein
MERCPLAREGLGRGGTDFRGVDVVRSGEMQPW